MFIAAPQTFFSPAAPVTAVLRRFLSSTLYTYFQKSFFPGKEVDWYSAEIKTTTNEEERISTAGSLCAPFRSLPMAARAFHVLSLV
jgi:hypothetical protein